jgi:hypothetical protein
VVPFHDVENQSRTSRELVTTAERTRIIRVWGEEARRRLIGGAGICQFSRSAGLPHERRCSSFEPVQPVAME